MTQLFAPVCSITITKRRRFFWAAWWSGPPMRVPFRKPDASDGGAATLEEALAAASLAAGASLHLVEPKWARACLRMLRGQPPWSGAESQSRRAARTPSPEAAPNASIWEVLGVPARVSLEELKLAFRRRALETHPDQGGDAEAFRRLLEAYEEAQRRVRRPAPKKTAKP